MRILPTAAVLALTLPLAAALPVGVPPYVAVGNAVHIAQFKFDPQILVVATGSTVTWTNLDAATHTATDDGGAWNTGSIPRGESRTVAFSGPGEYHYVCSIHGGMQGYIVVVGA